MGLPPFQDVLDQHRVDVYRYLRAALGPVDADDAFQETFLSALRAYPRLRHDDNLRSWLFTIASRKALDVYRQRKRQPTPIGAFPDIADGGRVDREPALWSAVRRLPAKQRDAVLHRFVNDLPYADIARIMGTTAAAARRSVHEGVKRLKSEGVRP